MDIYDFEGAFGANDVTSGAMRAAIADWFAAYYDQTDAADSDHCQRIAYTVVEKLVRTVFGEYTAQAQGQRSGEILKALEQKKEEAVQLALIGGESYLRPIVEGSQVRFSVIPRDRILIFKRDGMGVPTDVGCAARTRQGKLYYTLLERRTVDENGFLTVTNTLYRSGNQAALGVRVRLSELAAYSNLADSYTFREPVGSVGLVRLRTPMFNCVDGSDDGVCVYGPAMGLIRAIDENEAQLRGEFSRGQSRIVVSRDMLDRDKKLSGNLFVGLDEDPEHVGITVFSPQLRVDAFLKRKQEYLRNVESVIGLKRGMLGDVNELDRTATEVASSAGDFNLAVIGFQRMWENALQEAVRLGCVLARLYGLGAEEPGAVSVDWGNGILYDEDAQWQNYLQMVDKGLLMPEVALGWRFGMPAQTQADLEAIRKRFMPRQERAVTG